MQTGINNELMGLLFFIIYNIYNHIISAFGIVFLSKELPTLDKNIILSMPVDFPHLQHKPIHVFNYILKHILLPYKAFFVKLIYNRHKIHTHINDKT